MREIIRNWIGYAALALVLLLAFHVAMQADAKRMCASEATATKAVCAQAGVS